MHAFTHRIVEHLSHEEVVGLLDQFIGATIDLQSTLGYILSEHIAPNDIEVRQFYMRIISLQPEHTAEATEWITAGAIDLVPLVLH